MSKNKLIYVVTATTVTFISISLIISIVLNTLHKVPIHPVQGSSMCLTAVNCILVGLLAYRLCLESSTVVPEWTIVGKVRVRTLFSTAISINASLIAAETMWTACYHQQQDTIHSKTPRLVHLTATQGALWALSTYSQGFLCALSLVLSNILDNQSRRLSNLPVQLGNTAESALSTTDSQPYRSLSPSFTSSRTPSSSASTLLPLCQPQSPPARKKSAKRPIIHQLKTPKTTLRSVPSIDSILHSSPPLEPSSPPPRFNLPSPSPTTTTTPRESLLDSIESNIHPIFRPSSPELPPTPSSGTMISAAQLVSLRGANEVALGHDGRS